VFFAFIDRISQDLLALMLCFRLKNVLSHV